jgi:cyclopropane-fatty-acyl-phospholipid synthase
MARLNNKQQKLVDLFARHDILFVDDTRTVRSDYCSRSFAQVIENKPQDIFCDYHKLTIVLNAILKSKTLGLGESYIKGYFTCRDLFSLLYILAKTDEFGHLPLVDQIPNSWGLVWQVTKNQLLNLSLLKQFQVAKQHYDLPDVLFTGIEGKFIGMLGSSIKYTCADFSRNPDGLDLVDGLNQAQNQSLKYIINQVDLAKVSGKPVILDCGCGWGAIPKYLLETLGEGNFTYIGVTISQSQVDSCTKKFTGNKGVYFFNHSFHDTFLPILAQLNIEKVDVSFFVGSLEHAGHISTKRILSNIRQITKPGAKVYIQIVGSDHPSPLLDPYIWKYIFPNTRIMCPGEIGKIIEHERSFRLVNQDNTYYDYYLTLMAWHDIFEANWHHYEPFIAGILKETGFATTEEWKRHWKFYLLICASFYQAGTYPQLYRITIETNLNLTSEPSLISYLTRAISRVFNF